MSKIFEGSLNADPKWKVALVASRFNELITGKLLEGAKDCLKRAGMQEQNIHLAWVPRALEITGAAKRLVATGNYDGILCLGAVIRGSTYHFDIVAGESAKGLAQLNLNYDIPVINAIITTENIEQAVERAGTKAGNKGFDGAMGLIEMMPLYSSIDAG